MATVAEKINTGFICTYLAANEIAGGKLVGGQIDPRLPKLIYAQTMGLQYLYNLSPANADLEVIGNFLIAICRHWAKAQSILGTSGGAVAPITGSSLPKPYEFTISASSTPLSNGQASVTLDGTGGNRDFRGFNVIFFRGTVPQSPLNTESSYFGWDSVTGLFTVFPAAFSTELFQIYPIG